MEKNHHFVLLLLFLFQVVLSQDAWSRTDTIATDTRFINHLVTAIDNIDRIYLMWSSLDYQMNNYSHYYSRLSNYWDWTESVLLRQDSVRPGASNPGMTIFSPDTLYTLRGVHGEDNTPIIQYILLTKRLGEDGTNINQTIVFQTFHEQEQFAVYNFAKNNLEDVFFITDIKNYTADEYYILFKSIINETWSDSKQITNWNKKGIENEPSIFVNQNTDIHVVFVGQSPEIVDKNNPFNNWRVYYINSNDKGKNWSEAINININLGWHAREPQILVDNMNVRHVIWTEDKNGDLLPDAIYYSYSSNGTYWSDPVQLSPNNGQNRFVRPVKMVFDINETIHIANVDVNLVDPYAERYNYYFYGRMDEWSALENIIPPSEYPLITNSVAAILFDSENRLHVLWIHDKKDKNLIHKQSLILYKWKGVDKPPQPQIPTVVSINVYPNPFNNNITIEIQSPEIIHGDLSIYNIKGQLVRNITKNAQIKTQNTFEWNGQNNYGKNVASGIFIVFFNGNNNGKLINISRKIIYVR
ncbi:MAG: T9SS type A sorting domain-containing protein [Planctomycetia bacterium]|nr:T9SS type A sorting domain-containing protein [Planctomycetia bacterium]